MESDSTASIKTVKWNETKPDSINAQQMMEELRKEMQQMFRAVMEASPRPHGLKLGGSGCKKCKEEGTGENCSHCFKCGQEGHFLAGAEPRRETGRDY